jgi:hypothetical protein
VDLDKHNYIHGASQFPQTIPKRPRDNTHYRGIQTIAGTEDDAGGHILREKAGDTGRIHQGRRDPQGSREIGDSSDGNHRGVGEKENDGENQPSLNK